MTTFSDMYNRIADELFRPDLIPEIKLAINTAISNRGNERFTFNERIDSFNTVSGQEYYSFTPYLPYTPVIIDILRITRPGGTVYDLIPWDFYASDEIQSNPACLGVPYQWATYNNMFRLFPVPQSVFKITCYYVASYPTLVNDSDTNPWLVQGEEAIRMRAKADVTTNVIRDPQNGLIYNNIANGALSNLYEGTTSLLSTGRVRATDF